MAADPEVIEGEATALAVVESRPDLARWTPRFAITVDDAVEQVEQKREFMSRVMRKDEHYGIIPGTPKPTLLKPGAELLLSSMGLHPEYQDAALPVEDITGGDHGGEPFILYRRDCLIYRQTGPHAEDRMLVAKASGLCSSWEEKYRYRDNTLTCPTCGKATVIKGKEEYGGGWICFKRKGGCGAKFAHADPKITSQPQGKVANPNIPDLLNTILKMADKRALVAATLLATGCSDLFTQDVEDRPASASTYDAGDYEPPGAQAPPHGSPPKESSPAVSERGSDSTPPAPRARTSGHTITIKSDEAGKLRNLVLSRAVEVKRAQIEKDGEKASEDHLKAAAAESIVRVFEKPLADMSVDELKAAASKLGDFLTTMGREVPA